MMVSSFIPFSLHYTPFSLRYFTRGRFHLLLSQPVIQMIHRGATLLARKCCERGWVQEELSQWCVYTLEKKLGELLFFSAVLLWVIISNLCIETFSFLVPFYCLRQRMGGCHAKNATTCFFLSIGLVIIVSSVVGTWLLGFRVRLLVAIAALIVMLALILRPAYPVQVYFSEQEKDANFQKKNRFLVIFFLFQVFSIVFFDKQILTYSICGIAFCIVTVIIQKVERMS